MTSIQRSLTNTFLTSSKNQLPQNLKGKPLCVINNSNSEKDNVNQSKEFNVNSAKEITSANSTNDIENKKSGKLNKLKNAGLSFLVPGLGQLREGRTEKANKHLVYSAKVAFVLLCSQLLNVVKSVPAKILQGGIVVVASVANAFNSLRSTIDAYKNSK